MTLPAHEVLSTFAVLKPDLTVRTVEVTPSLYRDLDADHSGFRNHVLISAHEFSADWATWERHPAGDELVMLLSGEAELIVKTESGQESVVLGASGSYIVIPRNTWHTARVAQFARMLFLTPGEGTENVEHPCDEAG